jgi:BNR repeat-like domain
LAENAPLYGTEGKMKRTLLAVAAVGLFLMFIAPAAQAQWTTTKRLTWNSGRSETPSLAADDFENIHVVWADDTPSSPYGEIYYRKSTDGGTNWTPSRRLTWTSENSAGPVIAVDAFGGVHVAWFEYKLGYGEIFYKKSTDGGASWLANQRLTWNSGESYGPAIAIDPYGIIHVVWYDYTPGNEEIFYKKSEDGGMTWTPNKRLTWSPTDSYNPAIASDASGNLLVAWEESGSAPPSALFAGGSEIYFKKSPDGGVTWTPGKRLTFTSDESSSPAIAVDPSGRIHVLWSESIPGNWEEIYQKKSTDGGATWTAIQRLTWNTGQSRFPAVIFDAFGEFHLVWEDATPGNWEVYYKKSLDDGATWSAGKALTSNSGYTEGLAIAADSSGNLHVVWDDDKPGNSEIYYRKFIR